jgi:hypothetical protein
MKSRGKRILAIFVSIIATILFTWGILSLTNGQNRGTVGDFFKPGILQLIGGFICLGIFIIILIEDNKWPPSNNM